jgi:hypothetical protein
MCQDIDKHNAISLVMQTTKTETDKCNAWSVFQNGDMVARKPETCRTIT